MNELRTAAAPLLPRWQRCQDFLLREKNAFKRPDHSLESVSNELIQLLYFIFLLINWNFNLIIATF